MSDAITDLGAIAELAAMPEAIRRLDDAVTGLQEAGLSRRLIVLMLHDVSKVNKGTIEKVLDALPLLADRFLENT